MWPIVAHRSAVLHILLIKTRKVDCAGSRLFGFGISFSIDFAMRDPGTGNVYTHFGRIDISRFQQ